MRIFRCKPILWMSFPVLIACTSPRDGSSVKKLFTSLNPKTIGIDFVNNVEYTEEFNVYTYRNFYNGGGVGVGDINNDGFPDLFFCGNMVDNRLYLNNGDFTFRDITENAGVASPGVWSTGVSMVDINGDGWLDIYVCKSGNPEGENRHNELFINNRDLTFSEKAGEYGINNKGLSTHAAFFDFDKDGDLDCYLLNNSFQSVGGYNLAPGQRNIRDTLGGNKFYRNDNNHFTDISEEAGIYGSSIGFGLGVSIADINMDGWQDIYISNDFFEKDYLYMNNGDGTFSEVLENQINELSIGSMGADIADINNDGFPEIFVTEMLPKGEARLKTKAMFESWDKYSQNIKNGYYRQFGRNVLQLNNGIVIDGGGDGGGGDDRTYFSEIGRLAGVEATDWSWGALILDMDNDGWKDLFVANGIYKDLLDQDYINFMAEPETVRQILRKENRVLRRLVDAMPSEPVANYAFANNGDLTFTDNTDVWGLNEPGFSSGSAFGDLDNDGDLDIVVNNVNMPPFIYRNEANSITQNHSLTVRLEFKGGNRHGLGSQVIVRAGGFSYYQELAPMRGFESNVDNRLHFGLGDNETVDSLIIYWPDNTMSVLSDLEVDREINIDYSGEKTVEWVRDKKSTVPIFKDISSDHIIEYTHIENEFVDFNRDPLIFHMLSTEGPPMAVGDVNSDGLEDFYIGAAKDSPGVLFMQSVDGNFSPKIPQIFIDDKISEDTDALLFDADGDLDLDLYVTSGGNEFSSSSMALADRLYLNTGQGEFVKSDQILPEYRFTSTSCVEAADFDKDGDMDLFVGARLRPFLYGVPVNGYILENDGYGNFENVTPKIAPELIEVGMITDMVWCDYDNDGDVDIIIAGEWMPLKVFANENGIFTDMTIKSGLQQTNGFWNSLETEDIDNDGDPDLIAGNLGQNTRIRASLQKPATMYINDFDGNGRAEQIICTFNGDLDYPLIMMSDLIRQIPSLGEKYFKHAIYKEQRITDIFDQQLLERSVKLQVFTTASSVFINDGNGMFEIRSLPTEAQFAPVYAIKTLDYNHDGLMDILLGGNLYGAKPETGIYDASYGVALKGKGNMDFQVDPHSASGFFVKGEIRDIEQIETAQGTLVMVARNNNSIKVFRND